MSSTIPLRFLADSPCRCSIATRDKESCLRQTTFQGYPFLVAPVVVLPHLSAPSHCFADGVILAEGRLLLTLEFCWFPVSVFHRYP
ncbi:hypothetical protein MRX96_023075 [Rhipicephalus microplus]